MSGETKRSKATPGRYCISTKNTGVMARGRGIRLGCFDEGALCGAELRGQFVGRKSGVAAVIHHQRGFPVQIGDYCSACWSRAEELVRAGERHDATIAKAEARP